MKKVVNERASGLSLSSTCLLLGKLDASEKVIVIGIVATVEIPEWEAFGGQYDIDAKLRKRRSTLRLDKWLLFVAPQYSLFLPCC